MPVQEPADESELGRAQAIAGESGAALLRRHQQR